MLRSTVYTHYIIYDVPAYKINATMKATDIIKTVHKIKINKTIKRSKMFTEGESGEEKVLECQKNVQQII